MSDLENQEPQDHNLVIEQGGSTVRGDTIFDDSPKATKVTTEGEYVQFGNEKFLRSELVDAFGGSLTTGLQPPPKHDFANPAPLGLSGIALTFFVLGLIHVEARGVVIPDIVIGLAFFYGGAATLVAGLFEIAVGNSFGGVALGSYAGFWASWASIQVNSFGITEAYALSSTELRYAVGIFMVGWFIFTFFLTLCTLKSTVAFTTLFGCLTLVYLLWAIAEFKGTTGTKKALGVFEILASLFAWYNAYSGLANKQNSYIPIKVFHLPDLEEKIKHH